MREELDRKNKAKKEKEKQDKKNKVWALFFYVN
jgi:hypothetical protein